MMSAALLLAQIVEPQEPLAAPGLRAVLLVAAALGLLLMLPSGAQLARRAAVSFGSRSPSLREALQQRIHILVTVVGGALFLTAFAFFAAGLPMFGGIGQQTVFWILTTLTVIAAAATIAMRSAVYAAIWFAVSLLGTAGLFIFQGAQFLGVATIVVYAGAIVVTFLFVVMLAQPQGHTTYDRISWGWLAEPMAVAAAAVLVAVLTITIVALEQPAADEVAAAPADAPPSQMTAEYRTNPVLVEAHMARFGRELFGRHLVSVEVAGTLLLAALVGAVAIIIAGKPRPDDGADNGPHHSLERRDDG